MIEDDSPFNQEGLFPQVGITKKVVIWKTKEVDCILAIKRCHNTAGLRKPLVTGSDVD